MKVSAWDHYEELYADALDDPGTEVARDDAATDAWFERREAGRG